MPIEAETPQTSATAVTSSSATPSAPSSPSPGPDLRTDPVMIGIDVGSTTVKAAVVDPVTRKILWADY
ncbi:MAG: hypothetical protein ABJA82_08710, partial [Myxococcales bacterium]